MFHTESAKEAEEEPGKEQEVVHKHEHPGEEHTELQLQEQLKYAETAISQKSPKLSLIIFLKQ